MGCNGDCNGHSHQINDIVKEYRDSCGAGCNLFENPVFDELFDGVVRPGGLSLTEHAMELCNFKKGAKILDIGCGYGSTVEFLESHYDVDAVGIDLSTTMLERGKKRNPKLNLLYGDAEMLDFPSLTFDGIFMECVLSLTDNLAESLHESYCVLQKGGKLVITDFYLKEPDKATPALRTSQGCCGHTHPVDHVSHPDHSDDMVHVDYPDHSDDMVHVDHVDHADHMVHADHAGSVSQHIHDQHMHSENQAKTKTCLNGAFAPEELKATISEIGFEVLFWEDKNKELKDFTATLIMHFGSLDAFFESVLQEGEESTFFTGIERPKKLGYFLLIAEKK